MLLQLVEGELTGTFHQFGLIMVHNSTICILCSQWKQLLLLRHDDILLLLLNETRVLRKTLVAFLRLKCSNSLLVMLHVNSVLPYLLVDGFLYCFEVDQRLAIRIKLSLLLDHGLATVTTALPLLLPLALR